MRLTLLLFMKRISISEAIKQGLLLLDENANIVYFNKSYGDFIGHSLEECKGHPLLEFRPNAKAPTVIRTGVAERSLHRTEHGQEYFTDIYPIVENGKVVGSISVVTYLDDVKYMKDRLQEIDQEKKLLEARLSKTNGTHYSFSDIVGESKALSNAVIMAKRVARFENTVLLQGESGSGKELFAQAIHNESNRANRPFVAINCAAITSTLLESELFGYEEGAFTGARKGGKPGLFETAKGGTLFLDEISEMGYELQAKLLRVLQEESFRRIGGNKEIKADVRLICACNVDLMQYIDDNRFRRDLYYRIAGVPISIPPLRDREGDILILAEHFLQDVQIQHKRKYFLNDEVKLLLNHYKWPGNIRELRNTIDYAAMMSMDGEIGPACLPPSVVENPGEAGRAASLPMRVKEFERHEIMKELMQYGGLDASTENKRMVAENLGISLSSLYAKLVK